MRILVLTHEYPPVGGGGGRVAQDICTGLARRGHQVTVLTAQCDALPQKEVLDRLTLVRIQSGRRQPFRADMRAMLGYVWAGFWQGRRIIRRWQPDVIHVHFAVPAGVVAWALSVTTGVPYVLTAHLGDVPGGVPEKTGNWFRWIKPFTPPIWRRAASVAAVSEFTRGLALKHYPVEMDVIPNGVDLQALDPGEMAVHNPPQVVFAGRFMAQKNPVQIVDSLAAVADLPWQCVMMGDGPLRPVVEAAIARHGLQERFILPGWVTPQEVIDCYRASDIFFMPSLSEGLPVVGVQSLAMGLALVLGAAGGNLELVEEGVNGFLRDPHDREGFASALRELLSDPARLLAARQASRAMAERFDLNVVVAAYEALFEQTMR
ncbi:MAG: glycosyltransferase family 4 protein [Anaerolineaceae bacterium]|jgi:glycosyltransferase involved in cell wall biosynthesis|nr:glycosyltransferase family 4 protein [Anaerolineaceae bacterium]